MPKLIFILVILLTFNSCKDFFEEDLGDKNITLITPSNGAISTNLNITFDWDDVEGAINYRMLLGSPSLSNPSFLYVDSTIDLSTLLFSLSPGDYEWKIRAENNSSETNYSTIHQIKIDSSYNLSSQTIILYAPADNFYTNNNVFNFVWQELYAAENYQLVIKDGLDWNTGSVLLDTLITAINLTNPLTLVEGNYIWSVKGKNTLPSETSLASAWLLNIDLTSPNSANLNFPVALTNGLNADSSYLFDWSRVANNGAIQSPLFDSIFIYSDTIQNPLYSYGSLQEDTTLTLPNSSGTYYWYVVTYDKAGNFSSAPYFKQFTVL